ncbi:MAG: hypothetical protein KZQ64_05475 [gamma proteobacterium symbiont of Bathyaustriella thionipta]|nr:hypothetical protein [gamma proteobacterium symbiont of Bathyaustriella thionipta]MCU7950890.1 hypothetical protein [gamma proteobacterium symbiont of Bathyaustriella thionipta]MCU7952829.1 hypothetical protein [gamma proteobacterium symbiont of Bathyaustriella thionipta]MCU7957384.1 hypothetical protein [gamma proteobacterium symbiont of Bathyaustriella thionipta]MCU7967183.1 hypothetical protein [gamma proteobacterium symbiont of Bathyaustriella thionipta]
MIIVTPPLYAVQITSEPNLVALAARPFDHPYEYQVLIKDAKNPIYRFDEAPQGMTISSSGLIKWVPDHSQTFKNSVSIRVTDGLDEVTQTFTVFVNGINQAQQDHILALNTQFNLDHTNEHINQNLMIYIGDSQSYQHLWGNSLFSGSMTEPHHHPRMWGYPHLSNHDICDDVLNEGNLSQSWLRGGVKGDGHVNQSSMKASWGRDNVVSAWEANCGGAAWATVFFGHNDGRDGVDVATYIANIEAIVDSLLVRNTIPILFTVPTTVAGGKWGSATAHALYAEYSDSLISLAQRKNVPIIDLRSGVQSAINLGIVANINEMLNDDVHIRYDRKSPSEGENLLHNRNGALNIAMHNLVHMIGYMFDTGCKTKPAIYESHITDKYR